MGAGPPANPPGINMIKNSERLRMSGWRRSMFDTRVDPHRPLDTTNTGEGDRSAVDAPAPLPDAATSVAGAICLLERSADCSHTRLAFLSFGRSAIARSAIARASR